MSNKKIITRRDFLIKSAFGSAGIAFANSVISGKSPAVSGANERFRIGVIGLGNRGVQHLNHFLSLPNVEVVALCDIQESALLRAASILDKSGHKTPRKVFDYRRLLDLNDIDAVSVAVPRDLRTAFGIDGVKSGKPIFIEKPFSANIKEGRKMVAEAQKYNQLVQQRDSDFFGAGTDFEGISKFSSIGRIERIAGTKSVYFPFSKVDNDRYDVAVLSETAFDELDFSRCLMECEIPSKISTFGSLSNYSYSPIKNLMTQFEFSGKEGTKHINLELRFSSNHYRNIYFSNNGQHKSLHELEFQSALKILGTNGEIVINSDSRMLSNIMESNFSNFVRCVKERNNNGLVNPAEVARKSNLLVHLMELSLNFKRGFDFNPETETVMNDEQINNYIK
jgi:hypothetical protein